MAKMTDRELLRLALVDAMAWRYSTADAAGAGSVLNKYDTDRAGLYRVYYEKKYGKVTIEQVKERRIGLKSLRGEKDEA